MHYPDPEAWLVVAAAMSQPSLHALPGGQAAVFSTPSPARGHANEDAAALLPIAPHAAVLVVADGVGGSRAGAEAAAIMVQAVAVAVGEVAAARAGIVDDPPQGGLRAPILDAIERANREIIERTPGGATTVAVVELNASVVRPYHVGDAAVLLLGQRGKLKLQTVSHSPVGFALEAGMLDERQALVHAQRHIVSNVVGADEMRIEIGARRALAPRDTLLLGSDGLFDNLRVEEIAALVCRGPLELAAATLALAARARMQTRSAEGVTKPDDLTFIAYRPALRGATARSAR